MTATIVFRTKVRQLVESDGSRSDYIEYKRKVSRVDCNMRPHEHAMYNADVFPSILQRAYDRATEGKERCRLSALPDAVTVVPNFLATVTVRIEL